MTAGTTDRIPRPLPTRAAGFVGRRRELAELLGVLDGARLVTVTGVGGVGKTRLALEAAAQASGRYPDGVFLVELSPLPAPGRLTATVAGRLGLPSEDGRPQLAALLDYLRDRTLLLILDTCEHLVDEGAKLAGGLLREAPGVTILATSRQPLDVAGESAFRGYELCPRAEQLLWARLSVFAGTFDLAAAEEVCAGGQLARGEIVETLIGLVEKSVLVHHADRSVTAGVGRTEYRMLATIRQFGADQLAGTSAEAITQSRLVAYYLALAQRWGRDPMQSQLAQYRGLYREHANLRAAMEYALDLTGNDSAAVAIATSLAMYWRLSGQLREGEYWLNRVLEHCPRPSPARARVLGPAAT